MKKCNFNIEERMPKFMSKVVGILKFVIFTVTTLIGFWAIFTMIWFALGFPQTTTAMWLLFIQAVISELHFIKWIN